MKAAWTTRIAGFDFAQTLKNKSIAARIVSLHKSYVRPIVRGKNGKEVEFGAKVQLSCVDGYLFSDHISFENFNESTKLEASVTAFQTRFAKLPEHIAMGANASNANVIGLKVRLAIAKPTTTWESSARKTPKPSNPGFKWRS